MWFAELIQRFYDYLFTYFQDDPIITENLLRIHDEAEERRILFGEPPKKKRKIEVVLHKKHKRKKEVRKEGEILGKPPIYKKHF